MTDTVSVDCNDEGIYFVEATTKSPLIEFLTQHDLNLINKFFPVDGGQQSEQISGAHGGKAQVTSFACGGLVICPSISHVFCDCSTFISFMRSWAASSRKTNSKEAVCPSYDGSSLFPPCDAYPREFTFNAQVTRFLKTGRVVTRRFLFEAKAIADLKARAATSSVQNPTRVEVVSALLSKCVMAAFKTKLGSYKPTLLTHVVNLRRKARPPLSEHLVGTIVYHAKALCTGEVVELDDLAYKFRQAITKIEGDFVKSLRGAGGFRNVFKAIQEEAEVYSDIKDTIIFSSWCNFGLYDVDFGWGKPIWVSIAGSGGSIITSPTCIILTDTSLADGIEAWVLLLEEYMTMLEIDTELLAFATLDPSPLRQGYPVSLHVSLGNNLTGNTSCFETTRG